MEAIAVAHSQHSCTTSQPIPLQWQQSQWFLVDSFIKMHDPSWIMDFYNIFDNKKATKHIPMPRKISASSLAMMSYVSRIDLPH
jgi:hypothetical protein